MSNVLHEHLQCGAKEFQMSRQVDPFDEFAPGLTAAEEEQRVRFSISEQHALA